MPSHGVTKSFSAEESGRAATEADGGGTPAEEVGIDGCRRHSHGRPFDGSILKHRERRRWISKPVS